MEESRRTYIPAAGLDWALPLYDPIVKLFGAMPFGKIAYYKASAVPEP